MHGDRVGYATLRALRGGETVDLNGSGIRVRKVGEADDLTPGDDYVGARNTVELLTVREVNWEQGWVNPIEMAYPFDLDECVKVEIVTC